MTTSQTPAEYKRSHRKQLRSYVSSLKESQPCMDCGFFYPSYVMEYDHRPGENKTNTVSRMVAEQRTVEYIMKEIAKCDLVCSNCHAIRTYSRIVYKDAVADGE